ncbi:MAG: protein of unknown function with transrane region [Parcubacteria group bacterium]|nr:protein of unknown function with transrane region [Parcubacteria group bacterium]
MISRLTPFFIVALFIVGGVAVQPVHAATACLNGSQCASGMECAKTNGGSVGVCVPSGSTGKQCTSGTQCADGLECYKRTNQTVGSCVISGTGGKTTAGGYTGGTNPGTDAGASAGTQGGTNAGAQGGTAAGATGGTNPGTSGGTLQNPLNNIDSLPKLLEVILGAVVKLGSILLVVMLVWVGFLFVMAQGNPEEITKARSALVWTLIGGMILLGAQAISSLIQATVTGL